MKVSQVSVIAIIVVVTAVLVAGCTSPSPDAPAKSLISGPPSGGSGASSDGTSPGSSGAASVPVSGSQLLGGLNYNWIEYKIIAGSGNEKVTMYEKWTKEGKCTIRFESVQQIAGMPYEMDCSGAGATSSGSQTQSNPNDINPDVRLIKVGTETVTVGAGTFVADKYTATSGGITATYWIVSGKPLIKMAGSVSGGAPTIMELNGIG
jgi:hypothetical protein